MIDPVLIGSFDYTDFPRVTLCHSTIAHKSAKLSKEEAKSRKMAAIAEETRDVGSWC